MKTAQPFSLEGWEVKTLYQAVDALNRVRGTFLSVDQMKKAREGVGAVFEVREVLGLVKGDEVWLMEKGQIDQ